MTMIPRPSVLPQGRRQEWTEGVTFKAFRGLAAQRGWTPDAVASLLAARGANGWGGPRESAYSEMPKAYLHRVLRRGHAVDDESVIPYRCLIALYVEMTAARAGGDDVCRCVCGCGSPVTGRHRYATGTCRVRAHRQRRVSAVTDSPEGPENAQQRQGVFRYILADPVPGYPCNGLAPQIGSPAVAPAAQTHRGDGPVGTETA
jgi:hypothetical protein